MSIYKQTLNQLQAAARTWLVTGVAGFIGTNLLVTMLKLNQRVVGLDDFATGHQRNLGKKRCLTPVVQPATP